MKIGKEAAEAYITRSFVMCYKEAMDKIKDYDAEVCRKAWPTEREYKQNLNAEGRAVSLSVTNKFRYVFMKDDILTEILPDGTEKPYAPTAEDEEASDWHYVNVEIVGDGRYLGFELMEE